MFWSHSLPSLHSGADGFVIPLQGVTTVSMPGLCIHSVLQSKLGIKDTRLRRPRPLNRDVSSWIKLWLRGISCAEELRAVHRALLSFPAPDWLLKGGRRGSGPAYSGQILGCLRMAAVVPHLVPCCFRCCRGKGTLLCVLDYYITE